MENISSHLRGGSKALCNTCFQNKSLRLLQFLYFQLSILSAEEMYLNLPRDNNRVSLGTVCYSIATWMVLKTSFSTGHNAHAMDVATDVAMPWALWPVLRGDYV